METLEEILEAFDAELFRVGFNDDPTSLRDEYEEILHSSNLSKEDIENGLQQIKDKIGEWNMNT